MMERGGGVERIDLARDRIDHLMDPETSYSGSDVAARAAEKLTIFFDRIGPSRWCLGSKRITLRAGSMEIRITFASYPLMIHGARVGIDRSNEKGDRGDLGRHDLRRLEAIVRGATASNSEGSIERFWDGNGVMAGGDRSARSPEVAVG
jgi:hypothetical protein